MLCVLRSDSRVDKVAYFGVCIVALLAGLGLGHGLQNNILSILIDNVMHNNTWQSGEPDAVLRCSGQG